MQLAKRYSGFNILIKFSGRTDSAFNWDFGEGWDWDGTVVDKVAVATKPILGTVFFVY